jgi:L-lactate dehydrogenase complex protein LldE
MSDSDARKNTIGSEGRRVGLLVTCLIDSFRPEAGFASVRLLENAGYTVEVPHQGCCGQPNFNGGDKQGAQAVARTIVKIFADYDYVVVPSASCAAMLRVHYPELLAGSAEQADAERLAKKTWELTSFLVDVAGLGEVDAASTSTVTIHDACSALRELGVREQPRKLLQMVDGIRLREMPDADVCCGFGGTFCIKYPDISARIADQKLANVRSLAGVDTIVSTDFGCLMHLGGRLHREGSAIGVAHIAEVLTGELNAGNETTD